MSHHSVEDIKSESHRLRGSLLDSLADPVTGALRESDQTLIKYHGSYQQDDRDLRDERRRQKLEPAYQFMIRTRTPGGVVTPAQWLKLDAIATQYANHSLRITTRQAFQFHGVIKRELKATMQAINAALIFLPRDAGWGGTLTLALLFIVVNLPCIALWAVLGDRLRSRLREARTLRVFNGVMALLLAATALWIVADELWLIA